MHFSNRYRHKTAYNISAYNISQWVKDKPGQSKESLYSFSKHVLWTIQKFIASSDQNISHQHLPRMHPLDFGGGGGGDFSFVDSDDEEVNYGNFNFSFGLCK